MKIYFVRAVPAAGPGPAASAYVVAHDEDEAMVLLRKDINFSGYGLPPSEMAVTSASQEEVRRALGPDAAHEIGVYAFTVEGPAIVQHAGTPPAASQA